MKLAAMVARSLQAGMQTELRDIERAVAGGTRARRPRPQDRAAPAGCERRARPAAREQLARQALPEPEARRREPVYTKAPQIIRAFDEGAVIRSRLGRFLAIPTENAPRKGTDGRWIRTRRFPEPRFGPLRFVPRQSGPSLLLQDPDGHGEIRLRRGTPGETRLTPQGYFHAELRGLSQPPAQSTLEVFSPNCRADLGDERCRFPIEPPELGRDQAVSEGAFYRVPTAAGTGSGPLPS
jgi:hypothetical protein